MIEINLVPITKRKKKASQFLGGLQIPLEVIFGIGGGLFMLLIALHIFFLVSTIFKINRGKALKQEWASIEPSKVNVDNVVTELRTLQGKLNTLKDLTDQDSKIYWSKKLNILSDSLPRGVWFRKMSLTEEMLFIEGSAISKQKKEMASVHSFVANLKDDTSFLEGLSDLELESIQTRSINKVDIADFMITTKLKDETKP